MKKRSMISLLLALIMLFGLVACADAPTDGSVADESESSSAPAESESDGESAEGGGMPLVTEPFTLTVAVKKTPQSSDWEVNPFTEFYEDTTGITVEWLEIQSESYAESKNLMLASGDLPDVFFRGLEPNDVALYAPQGYFLPLNEYLTADIAPNLTAIFEQLPAAKGISTLSDGVIYSTPWIEELAITHIAKIFYVNQVWLDNLDLEAPTTVDEYYDVLMAFKEQDANVNGDPNDEIPLSGRSVLTDSTSIEQLFSAFGRPDNVDHYVVEDGQVVFTADKQEYRDAVEFVNKLYNDGLLDPEFFTQTTAQLSAKGQGETVTIGSMFAWRDFQTVGAVNAEQYTPVAPLMTDDGEQIYGRANVSDIVPHAFLMSTDNPDPELTMRWIDHLYSRDMSIQATNGILNGDVQYVNEEDGLIYLDLEDKSGAGMTEAEVREHNSWGNQAPTALLAEYYGTDELDIAQVGGGHDRKRILNEYYEEFVYQESYPVLTFAIDDSEYIAETKAEVNAYVDEMFARWVTTGTIDEEWDEYVAELEAMGVNEYIGVLQSYYDSFNS